MATRLLGAQESHTILQGSVGVPDDHAFNILEAYVSVEKAGSLDLTETTTSTDQASTLESFAWPFEQVLAERNRVLVTDLSPHSADLPGRAWGDNPHQAVVVPIYTETFSSVPSAVLVLGLNPRADYTSDYEHFTQVVARHIAFALIGVTVSLLS